MRRMYLQFKHLKECIFAFSVTNPHAILSVAIMYFLCLLILIIPFSLEFIITFIFQEL